MSEQVESIQINNGRINGEICVYINCDSWQDRQEILLSDDEALEIAERIIKTVRSKK